MPFSKLRDNWFSPLLAVLLFGMAVVKYRHEVIRSDGTDLAVPYAGARAWMQGVDPYDEGKLRRAFDAAGGDSSSNQFYLGYLPPVYPPPTLVMLAPLAWAPWPRAVNVWEISSLILIVLSIAALLDLAQIRWSDPRAAIFILFCLVFAPLRSAFTLGQAALPAACLVILSIWTLRHRFFAIAGLCLAAAICLKPHDALFMLLALILLRQWRLAAWACGGIALVSLIALLRSPPASFGYVSGWLGWVARAAAPGEIDDPGTGKARFQMIHLPVALFTIMQNRGMVMLLTFIICSALGAVLCLALIRTRRDANASTDLLMASAVAAFTLVPFFHRFADASLLLIPIAWAIGRLGTKEELRGRITLLLLLAFLLQPNEIIPQLVARGTISQSINSAWWFRCFARASLVWVALILSAWLIWLLARQAFARRSASPA